MNKLAFSLNEKGTRCKVAQIHVYIIKYEAANNYCNIWCIRLGKVFIHPKSSLEIATARQTSISITRRSLLQISRSYSYHPDAFEHDLLSAHLYALRAGESIEYPAYCYKTHTRLQETEVIAPAPIIIIEGIMLLTQIHLFDHFNVKVFVDTALDVCLMRRMLRDTQERGRSMVSVATQYENTVKPMYHKFIEPSKTFADLIVPHGGENLLAVDVVGAYLFNPQNGNLVNG